MKKTLVAMAVLGTIAGAVQAQSTVTLYGRIDEYVASQQFNVNVGGTGQLGSATAPIYKGITQTKLFDGGFNGSRFGLKGSEDLGGGLSAIFNLEAGVNADAGSSTQGSTLFGRRSIVGISSTSWGTVGFGRNSSPFDDVASDHAMMESSLFDPSITNNGPASLAANGKTLTDIATFFVNHDRTTWLGYSTRFNNSVKYQSPNWSGFSFSGMYALGEDNSLAGVPATATNGAKDATATVSADAKYVAGPLLVSVGYQSEALGGTTTTTSAAGVNGNSGSTAVAALAGLKPALENTLISVAYDFGVAKVGVGYNQAKLKDVLVAVPTSATTSTLKSVATQNEYNLSVAVPFGATTLSAGYAVSQGDDLGKASGYGIQAKYALSKRTFVYGGYSNTTTYDTLTTILNNNGSDIQKLTTVGLGIQHQF
jgi:predicted porin